MDFTTYTTTGGETWTVLSFLAYGSLQVYLDGVEVDGQKVIAAANPDLPITPLLPGGLVIKIPALTSGQNTIDTSLLPSWKR
jgi:phage tail protein X